MTIRVRNTGDRAGTDVVQLYGHDVVVSITRPTAQLLGYQHVDPSPAEAATVPLVVPTGQPVTHTPHPTPRC